MRKATFQTAAALGFVALIGGGIAADQSGSSASRQDAAARKTAARVEQIARRVEEIRGLRFKEYPKPLVVSPKQTKEASLKELDREYPRERQRSDSELLALLGLVDPGTDLREVQGDISGGQVAGYYDTRRKRLAIVSGDVGKDELLTELTLSHELTHALEDQRFGVRDVEGAGADDRASAYTALVEGTATSVMGDYARRYVDAGQALVSALSAAGPAAEASASIPPYLQDSLEFPYTWGEKFVARLRKEDGGGWRLVDDALRDRPPVSTEQIIHPGKYLAREQPVRLERRGLRELLPPGWKRRAQGAIGEFDSYELLSLGVSGKTAGKAAAGWGAGSYELWGDREATGECKSPCRKHNVLVLTWAWDAQRDADEFDRAVRSYVSDGLDGTEARPPGTWTGDGGAAAVSARGLTTTLAFAPRVGLARALALRALVD